MDPSPVPTSKPTQSSIHTYHCLCTHLIFATTTPLTNLPTRSSSSLDKAYILPLPPPPSSLPPDPDSESEPSAPKIANKPADRNSHYALLLSTAVDRKAQIITRSDGFEKRYLQRCGRCRLVIGYQLDWAQFGEKEGRREDVVYLLPGGLLSTDEMVQGKDMTSHIALEE
ncbi:hypothetical protein K432DRAFT_349754 [Lepidopterella palustris CBS 459.81]|uniref:STEEP1 domain-containing protein n=1 Tax=Lepidopterella palustris CBS 459.81 TaxID=1314670 RepID=A0A8E2EDQ4_9PEZI|nr:hypothetical protein K432DRAFT_349754 [Lepidopterella palustris CBS 459.81]